MAGYYLVELAKWRSRMGPLKASGREQAGWDAHAAFMDSLAEEGTVILGGPVGEGDGEHSLLVVTIRRARRRSALDSPRTPGRTEFWR